MARKSRNVSNVGIALNLNSMATWVAMVSQLDEEMNPKTRQLSEDERIEVATMFVEAGKYLVKNANEFGRICNKDDDKTISLSLSIQLDRSSHPAQVSVRIGYAEKHSEGRKVTVPDPKQDELPLDTEATTQSDEDEQSTD